MTPPPPLPPDLLLAHAGSLRALAQSLLRDAHAAEDVLQETFARALERPPASIERLGAWLRVVLESVARKRMRGELRRARREHESARDERAPAVDEGLARGEVLRTVLDAVLALDEPYREVVLDRYFEGLSPREIARRRELSVHTVTSRLCRARGRLRERLARELGTGDERWQRKLCGVFGLALPLPRSAPIAIGVIPGALALSTKLKFITVTSLAALAGLGWFARGGDDLRPEPAEAAAALALEPEAPAARIVPESVSATRAESTRELVAPVAVVASEARALPPYRFPLLVVVRDADDRPLANAAVEVAPPAGAWNAAGVTDARGRLELELRGFRPTLTIGVRARAPFGGTAKVREVELRAGAGTGVAFGIPDAGVVQLVFSYSGNLQAQGGGPQLATFLRDASPRTRRELGTYPDGSRAFSGRPLRAPAAPEPVTENLLGDNGVLSFELVSEGFDSVSFEGATLRAVASSVSLEPVVPGGDVEAASASARATGQLVNADGKALGGVRIEARDEAGAVLVETRTDDEGAYALELEAADEVTLRAGGGERGIAELPWRPGVEPALRWNPLLDRGHELLGRLVDEEGAPLAGWQVEVRLDDAAAPWWDGTTTAEDGRFAIPNLPRRALHLALRPGDAENALAVVQLEDVWPGFEERTFELGRDSLRAGAVRVQVLGSEGAPLEGCTVRLWQRAGGFGATLGELDQAGSYAARSVPAGEYRLEVSHREHGSTEAASFRLVPGEELDLGLISLEAPAQLALRLPGIDTPGNDTAGLTLELWRTIDGHEERVPQPEGELPDDLRLASGRYELVATRGSQRSSRAITLEAGERKELVLDELSAPSEVEDSER